MWSTSDKDYILNTLDQVHIYSVFLNVPETEINNCICLRNYKISNPLRYDPNPSVSFKWYGNKLIFRDFADYRYRGDVFERRRSKNGRRRQSGAGVARQIVGPRQGACQAVVGVVGVDIGQVCEHRLGLRVILVFQ